jgi:UDP-glucose 4-epimerase
VSRLCRRRRSVPTPDGSCIRDYIHVSDLVRAHSDALHYLRAGGVSVTLNCGYGPGFSGREVVEMVKRVSGVDFKVEIAPRRQGDPARIVAASDLAPATLGWKSHYDDLATIIAHALAWESRACGKRCDARFTNRPARGARG